MIIDPSKAKATLYLSEKRTMYIGRLTPILEQATAASTLMLSIDKTLAIIDKKNNRRYESRSFLIPAGSQVTIDTNDSVIAMCFLDVLGVDLATLKQRMDNVIVLDDKLWLYSGIPNEAQVIASATNIYEFTQPVETALKQLDQWIGLPEGDYTIPADDRVTKAVELIKQSVVENISVEEIARELNLSVPRLSQLFKQITGVPIRRYRLWHRIFITAIKMGWGLSLTEASVSSGFSDSAHFSRVFKEIGGVKPSAILNSSSTLIKMLPPERKVPSKPIHEVCEG